MRGEDKSSCLKKTDLLFCTTFSSCNMCLLRFIQFLSYLSLSCTLSLFFYLSLPHCRCLVILTCASQHLSLALQESFPVQSGAWFPQISPFAPYVLSDWRRHAFYVCGFFFFLKSSATLNPKSSSSSIASEDEAGPFLRNGFKRCTLLFCKLHFVQDSIHNSIANNKLSTFLYVFQLRRSTGID